MWINDLFMERTFPEAIVDVNHTFKMILFPFVRQGTMAHLAIIVRSSYNSQL